MKEITLKSQIRLVDNIKMDLIECILYKLMKFWVLLGGISD
jgi:hypothetical protein